MITQYQRIAVLEPFLADLLLSFGLGERIVGVPHQFDAAAELLDPKSGKPRPVATLTSGVSLLARSHSLEEQLASTLVDVQQLISCQPDLILSSLPESVEGAYPPRPGKRPQFQTTLSEVEGEIRGLLGRGDVPLKTFAARTLEEIYGVFEQVGKLFDCAAIARDRAQRIKAQCMNWGDNFYERTRSKRVVVLSSVKPLMVAGLWVPDLLRMMSCQVLNFAAGEPHRKVSWDEIVAFKPDVICVLPDGLDLAGSMKSFHSLSKLPGWEDLPAVVRGEVIFAAGNCGVYRPSMKLLDGVGILFSGVAGFESGYITPRGSFQRLRWLELHRDKV